MYAIVSDRNKQYVVEKGFFFKIDRLDLEKGSILECSNILMFNDGINCVVGNPNLKNVVVKLKVKCHIKSKKVVTLKFKRRKHYMKKYGHRQQYTVVEVIFLGNV